jgi:hypothetical protein
MVALSFKFNTDKFEITLYSQKWAKGIAKIIFMVDLILNCKNNCTNIQKKSGRNKLNIKSSFLES